MEILRPLNSSMAFLGVLVGALIGATIGSIGNSGLWLYSIIPAGIVAGLYTGAGNALNDVYDSEVDKQNHPQRPIPSGRMSKKSAKGLAIGLFILGAALASMVNPVCLLIALFNGLMLVLYETHLKRQGLPGNITISYLAASLFLFGGAATIELGMDAMARTLMLAMLAFLATLGREIVKDIEDLKGDFDRVTLPRKIGVKRAGFIAACFFLMAVCLSPLPYILGLLPLPYLLVVLGSDSIFIYASIIILSDKRGSATAAKFAMLLALIAFIVGGIWTGS